MSALLGLAVRELRRGTSGWGITATFFLMVATLFPFAVGPDTKMLAQIGPGVLWVAALLAALLPVERLISPDLDAGVLDQLLVRGIADETIAAGKLVGHWLTFGPAILIAALPAALLSGLDGRTLVHTEIALLIGTPALAALGVAAAALVTSARTGTAIAGLLLLPLAVPILIFGSASAAGKTGATSLLAATALILVAGCPFAAGAAMRAARD